MAPRRTMPNWKALVLKAAQPVFGIAMRIPTVRRFVEGFNQSHGTAYPRLVRGLTPLYVEWYGRNAAYSAASYRSYQEKYWDTVGQWRWSRAVDYSDMLDTLERHTEPSDRTLLEIGCGTGAMLRDIGQRLPALSVTGVDASDKMCEKARALAPGTTIVHDAYGPDCVLGETTFDVAVARSTLTYVDEADIDRVLAWLARTARRLLVISEPSGAGDHSMIESGQMHIERVNDAVYKRLHDHAHIRDYATYPALRHLRLLETRLEEAHAHGNRQWVFAK